MIWLTKFMDGKPIMVNPAHILTCETAEGGNSTWVAILEIPDCIRVAEDIDEIDNLILENACIYSGDLQDIGDTLAKICEKIGAYDA